MARYLTLDVARRSECRARAAGRREIDELVAGEMHDELRQYPALLGEACGGMCHAPLEVVLRAGGL